MREHLDVRAQARERGAELVRGVGDELALRVERALERVQHLVEAAGERRELVVAGGLDPPAEVAGRRHLLGRAPQALDRGHSRPRDEPAEHAGERDPAEADDGRRSPPAGSGCCRPPPAASRPGPPGRVRSARCRRAGARRRPGCRRSTGRRSPAATSRARPSDCSCVCGPPGRIDPAVARRPPGRRGCGRRTAPRAGTGAVSPRAPARGASSARVLRFASVDLERRRVAGDSRRRSRCRRRGGARSRPGRGARRGPAGR